MPVDCLWGEVELRADLGIRVPFGDEPEGRPLA
jgi:hypothetical protein